MYPLLNKGSWAGEPSGKWRKQERVVLKLSSVEIQIKWNRSYYENVTPWESGAAKHQIMLSDKTDAKKRTSLIRLKSELLQSAR